MMQKTLRHLSLTILLSVVISGFAVASPGIAVTFLDYHLDSTQNVNLGYTLTINAEVRNTDSTQAFSGTLDFGLHNNGSVLTTAGIFNKPPYSGGIIVLNPGERVPALFSVNIEHPYFTPGPDVVVVWPISTSPISDSILINLFIETPSGIADKEKEHFNYTVMPNRIFLHYNSNEINFQQVRIFNILGQESAYIHSDFITEIPVPNLPKGIYLCEMISADRKKSVIKFLH
jgi:hypothetical protein